MCGMGDNCLDDAQFDEVFESVDTDGSGCIDINEFIAWASGGEVSGSFLESIITFLPYRCHADVPSNRRAAMLKTNSWMPAMRTRRCC
jgi:hypothetical protein